MASLLTVQSRRKLALSLWGLPLLGCASSSVEGGTMTIPPNAERIFDVTVTITDDDEPYIVEWTNQPPGPRMPGPFASPERDHAFATGFLRDLPKPILAFDQALGSKSLHEAYEFGSHWCVSDALKNTLWEIDSTAFDAVLVATIFPDGSAGPDYWLLDLVCFRDCYDRERSMAAGARVSERGVVDFAIGAPDANIFHARTLRGARFFHLPRNPSTTLCTAQAMQALLGAGHTRFRFFPVGRLT
jgi:Protein of unknown function (DUF1629)